jgi:hypothetical protein
MGSAGLVDILASDEKTEELAVAGATLAVALGASTGLCGVTRIQRA